MFPFLVERRGAELAAVAAPPHSPPPRSTPSQPLPNPQEKQPPMPPPPSPLGGGGRGGGHGHDADHDDNQPARSRGLASLLVSPYSTFHETPALQGINRLPSHVPLRSHRSVREALAYHTHPLPSARDLELGLIEGEGAARLPPPTARDEPRRRVLGGDHDSSPSWDFCLVASPDEVDPAFVRPDFEPSAAEGWGKVRRRNERRIGIGLARPLSPPAHTPRRPSAIPPPPPSLSDPRPLELGVPRPRRPHLHQLCLPDPGHPSSAAAARQPDGLLPPAV